MVASVPEQQPRRDKGGSKCGATTTRQLHARRTPGDVRAWDPRGQRGSFQESGALIQYSVYDIEYDICYVVRGIWEIPTSEAPIKTANN